MNRIQNNEIEDEESFKTVHAFIICFGLTCVILLIYFEKSIVTPFLTAFVIFLETLAFILIFK